MLEDEGGHEPRCAGDRPGARVQVAPCAGSWSWSSSSMSEVLKTLTRCIHPDPAVSVSPKPQSRFEAERQLQATCRRERRAGADSTSRYQLSLFCAVWSMAAVPRRSPTLNVGPRRRRHRPWRGSHDDRRLVPMPAVIRSDQTLRVVLSEALSAGHGRTCRLPGLSRSWRLLYIASHACQNHHPLADRDVRGRDDSPRSMTLSYDPKPPGRMSASKSRTASRRSERSSLGRCPLRWSRRL